MTQDEKDRLQHMIDVMTAYRDGKEIEIASRNSNEHEREWRHINEPVWDWLNYIYRVKPEPPKPQYRPFENADEVMQAIKEHGEWVRGIDQDYRGFHQIISVHDRGIDTYACNTSYDWALKIFEWVDGTPFGKLITE